MFKMHALRTVLALVFIFNIAYAIPLAVHKEDHHPSVQSPTNWLSRRTSRFSRIASHVTNSLKAGSRGLRKPHTKGPPTQAGSVPVSKAEATSAKPNDHAHAAGGFARIVAHVTKSLKDGSGSLKELQTGGRPAWAGSVPILKAEATSAKPNDLADAATGGQPASAESAPVSDSKPTEHSPHKVQARPSKLNRQNRLKAGFGSPKKFRTGRRPARPAKFNRQKGLKVGSGRPKKSRTGRRPANAGSAPVSNTQPVEHSPHKVKVSPADLNHYAAAANQHLQLENQPNHIMAAAHNEGSETVHLHSVPRGKTLLGELNKGGTHPVLESKMREGEKNQVNPDGSLAHHAETAAVNLGMNAEKSESTEGWSVGQAGHFANGDPVVEPCQGKCQETFRKAGIAFQKKV